MRADSKSATERMMNRDMLTDIPVEIKEKKLIQDLETRRKAQHAYNKSEAKVETVPYSIGDMVMMKVMKRLDRGRDLYIVAKVTENWVFVRKSEKQWRNKLYKVKPGQLVKILDSNQLVADVDTQQKATQSQENNKEETESKPIKKVRKLTKTNVITKPRPMRVEKLKAKFKLQQQRRNKLLNMTTICVKSVIDFWPIDDKIHMMI